MKRKPTEIKVELQDDGGVVIMVTRFVSEVVRRDVLSLSSSEADTLLHKLMEAIG